MGCVPQAIQLHYVLTGRNRGKYEAAVPIRETGSGERGVAPFEHTNLHADEGGERFGVDDFAPHTMQRTIAGMCGGQAFFKVSGRAFSAYVVLGSYRLRAPLVRVVNGLLAGLDIEPR